ncbi:MAG TPA: serine--tRNA ligase [Polyangiaceae bacterium]|nr:serine--tRNA ligase [Polyangiaceae bacterium]
MLDARYVAEHLDEVKTRLLTRSPEWGPVVQELSGLVERRRALIGQTEELAARRNAANKEMSALAKGGDKQAFAARRDELKLLGDQIKGLETQLNVVVAELEHHLQRVPNLPHPDVVVGKSEEDNRVVRTWGKKPELQFEAKAHYDLCGGLLDFDRASKLSGARFSVLWGQAARLERALGQLMLNVHTEQHGYTEVAVPYLVRANALFGTSQLPKFEDDLFKIPPSNDEGEALYLVPTAEVPVTNLHADEILEPGRLPLAYTALTPCFRSEAGSYGKDVRGLFRQHQFNKVELVRFVEPEDSMAQLELLTNHAEAILQQLGLHYRVVELCTGDMGFGSLRTYDLEVWLPSQNRYREISSCSCFGDFQARRAMIRYRPGPQEKPRYVHTLNGSGVAVGRALIAVFEQYQNADGTVTVPAALRPLVGQDIIAG